MNSPKLLLKRDLEKAINQLPQGLPATALSRRTFILSFLKDLSAIDRMVSKVSAIDFDLLKALIRHWKSKNYSKNSIYKKVSILRVLFESYVKNKSFPSNQALKVHYEIHAREAETPKTPKPELPLIIKNIFNLQYQFGLKKREAILFEDYMIQSDYVLMPRKVAYNRLDRFIPIVTAKQKELLDHFISSYSHKFIGKHHSQLQLATLHRHELLKLGIKNANYFRESYICNRYRALKQQGYELEALFRILRQEVGYRENRQIKEILACRLAF